MATADNELIEQIVANVLAELQPTPTVRAPLTVAVASAPSKSDATVIEMDLPIITANLLAERLQPGQSLRIGRRSILTPSARDWLGSRKMSCSRISGGAASHGTSARWQIMLTTVTPAVATLKPSLAGWKTELLGTPKEAAEFAIRAICTGEADGVFGLCGSAETVACLANRNAKLRAAVLHSAGELPGLAAELGPNLFVMNPRGKSFVELRNVASAVTKLAKPQAPSGI